MKTLYQLLLLFLMPLSGLAFSPIELKSADKEDRLLAWVTAVDVIDDKAGKTAYRLIKVDGSGTVAANPIKLYLTIDAEEFEVPLLLKLPAVSELASFEKVDGKVIVSAKFDEMSEEGVLSKGKVRRLVLSKSGKQEKAKYWLTEESKK